MGIKAAVLTVTLLTSAYVHYALMDGISGAILSTIFGDTTTYSSAYSDGRFRSVRTGMTDEQVRQLIGAPLAEVWGFVPLDTHKPYDPVGPCDYVHVRDNKVEDYVIGSCRKDGVAPFMPVADLQRLMGSPIFVTWRYSESRVDSSYRQRLVYFANGRVVRVEARFYVD